MSNFKDYFAVIETTKPIDEEGKYGLAAEVEYRQVKPLNFADLDLEPKESIVEHLKRQVRQKADIEISNIVVKEALIKAKQYDTISKQLGCPLEVVFKALKEGFYTQNNHHTKQDNTWLGIKDLGYCKKIICMYFDENKTNIVSCVEVDTRAYGKTWWLKENGNEED